MALLSKKKKAKANDAKTSSPKNSINPSMASKLPASADKSSEMVDHDGMASASGNIEDTDEVKPLAQVVEESKQALAEAEQAQPVKRGRKPGSKNKPKEDKQENVSTAGSDTGTDGSISTDAQGISDGIQFLGAIAADQTGYDGWNVKENESQRLGIQIDRCMSKYFPQLSEGNVLLATTVLSLGYAIGGRYIGYRTWRRELEEKQRASSSNAQRANEQPQTSVIEIDSGPKVSANEFFPRGK